MTTSSDIYRAPAKPTPSKPMALTMEKKLQGISRYREQYNPLRGLTLARAVSLMEAAQRGEYADLQWLYNFIEMTDATPFALVERRVSTLLKMDWNIKIVDQEKAGFDEALAKRQQDELRAAYDRIMNLYEAIEHLEMASFRGFAHLQAQRREPGAEPVPTMDGCNHLEVLDQWNWVRDGMNGPWYWNPEARQGGHMMSGVTQVDEENDALIIRTCKRHIDRIACVKFIRKNLGEKDWAAFLEIYGIPGCFVIGPPDVPTEKESEYEAAAQAAAEGGSGSLPNGADVKFAEGPRGTNPFLDYIKYFDEQMVLAGTGGQLTMLASPTGIGQGASDAHEDTFIAIAQMEARKISELFQRKLDARILSAKFPNKPALAYFELAFNEETYVKEILEHARTAKEAGFAMDAEELSEKTGYKLSPIPPGEGGLSGGAFTGNAFALSPSSPAPFRVRNQAPADGNEVLARAMFSLSDAQRQVLQPVAKRLQQILDANLEGAERDAALIRFRDEELPKLLIEINANPATARVMEELMAAELANGYAEAKEAVA